MILDELSTLSRSKLEIQMTTRKKFSLSVTFLKFDALFLEGLSKSSPNSYGCVYEHKTLKENLLTNDTQRIVLNISNVLMNGAKVFGKCAMKHRHSHRRKNMKSSNAKWTE